jgi:hypothetical protein
MLKKNSEYLTKIHATTIDPVIIGKKIVVRSFSLDREITKKKFKLKDDMAEDHEGGKPLKCEICDYPCSCKNSMNTHVASVHEGKKQFKYDNCDYIHLFSKGEFK